MAIPYEDIVIGVDLVCDSTGIEPSDVGGGDGVSGTTACATCEGLLFS